jgi:S-formylglutathione hydrolase FrmB
MARYAGWYFDSPANKDFMYETYICKELVGYVDSHYATIATRKGRAITGLSMGGHGALFSWPLSTRMCSGRQAA